MTQIKALLYIYWLLIINTLFVEQNSHWINFFTEKETFDHVTGNENDQVSPTFLSDRINAENETLTKWVQILFFNNPIFFFVIPKVCLIVCVFPFRNLEFEKDLRCTFDL